MRPLLLIALAACGGPAKTQTAHEAPPSTPTQATLIVEEVPPAHCGGARPADDYRPPPRALANQPLVVRRGSMNDDSEIVAEPTTDAEGRAVLSLPAGTYCIVEQAKRAPSLAGAKQQVDPDCLAQWQRACDGVIAIPRDEPMTIKLQRYCLGVCYTGPNLP